MATRFAAQKSKHSAYQCTGRSYRASIFAVEDNGASISPRRGFSARKHAASGNESASVARMSTMSHSCHASCSSMRSDSTELGSGCVGVRARASCASAVGVDGDAAMPGVQPSFR